MLYFLQLKASFEKQKTLLSAIQKVTRQQSNGMIVSQLVTKAGKSYTRRETLCRLVTEEVFLTVMHKNPDKTIKTILLSNNSISQCIDEMASNVKHQLVLIFWSSKFSIEVDESTIVVNQCLMMVYVCLFNKNIQACEEMLFNNQLLIESESKSILDLLKMFLMSIKSH